MQRHSLVTWVLLITLTETATPATAAVDMTGPWRVRREAFSPTAVEEDLWDFVQIGTALSVSVDGAPYLTGTVDPDTGGFALQQIPGGSCSPDTLQGQADQTSFGGGGTVYTFIDGGCFERFYIATGTRCGNGQLDAGEQCEDSNINHGDCCSSTCQLDPAGSACTDQNPCTDDSCDGAGTCQGMNNTVPCDDGLFCNGSDTCSAGACAVHSGNPCVGGPECADSCYEPFDWCDGPKADPCQSDGNACTLDVCDVDLTTRIGFCAHIPLSAAAKGDCGSCESCDGAGGCAAAPVSSLMCKTPVAPRAASLLVRDRTPNTRDLLVWKWRHGAATTVADFGDPAASDGYALCVFDESGATPTVVFRADMPAGGTCGTKPCWRGLGSPAGSMGLLYRDRERSPHGVQSMKLRPGAAGAAAIVIVGEGDNLTLGAPASLSLPLRVQLQATHGACWEATFESSIVNDGGTFKAVGE